MRFDFFFFFQAEDGIRDYKVTGVQTCALPISPAAVEGAGAVVPPGEETALLTVKPERVTEPPCDELTKRRTLGVAEHDLSAPLLRVPDVAILRGDVEVAAEHHRLVGLGGSLEA